MHFRPNLKLRYLQFAALFVLASHPTKALAEPERGGRPQLQDLNGKRIDPWKAPATVFLFLRTDCPIANSYAPEIGRLHAAFADRGVEFWLVYLDREETASAIQRHLSEFALPAAALRDSSHALAHFCGARSTPEAALFSEGKLVYSGRIDNRYVAPGKRRPTATVHDLEEAIVAVLAGRAPVEARTSAIGCTIADLP